jgi:hypothetical protein
MIDTDELITPGTPHTTPVAAAPMVSLLVAVLACFTASRLIKQPAFC